MFGSILCLACKFVTASGWRSKRPAASHAIKQPMEHSFPFSRFQRFQYTPENKTWNLEMKLWKIPWNQVILSASNPFWRKVHRVSPYAFFWSEELQRLCTSKSWAALLVSPTPVPPPSRGLVFRKNVGNVPKAGERFRWWFRWKMGKFLFGRWFSGRTTNNKKRMDVVCRDGVVMGPG